ncbi:TolC family protein [Helicobacter aurati]|uniref:TolC family protein n=1 Tax=Helicobacter aurati TaxID=137778 RepID=A0A3D8J6P0_9HELI|nr:TolC family protein [Helicobacter aurati]RDU72950.1 TolC family protein [Helicobacter aurati]
MAILQRVFYNYQRILVALCQIFLVYFLLNYLHCPLAFATNSHSIASNEESTHPFSIQEAWQQVLATHEGVRSEMLNTQKADKLALASKLSFLPEISLSALYLHLDKKLELDVIHDRAALQQIQANIGNTNPILSNILTTISTPITLMQQDAVLGALNIIYPIYTGGKRWYGSKIANVLAKDSREALRLRELATFEELVGIYYAVVLHKEILKVSEEMEQGALIHYQNANKLYKLGQIAQIELLTAQVAYDKAKNVTLAARNTLEVSQLALDSILNSTHVVPTSSLSLENYTLQNKQYYIDSALQSYPALRIAANNKQIAEYKKHIAFGNFMPKLIAFGSFIATDNRSRLEQIAPNWFMGIGANWSILSPDGKIQKYQIAKIEQLHATALESQAIKDIELLVAKSYKQVIFTHQEYNSLNSSILLAKENLRLQEKAFLQGIATSTQVNDARNALLSSLTQQQSIAYKEILYLAKLMALHGDITKFFTIVHH